MSPDDLILTWIHVAWSSDFADHLFNWVSARASFSLPLLLLLLIYASIKQGWGGLAWWLGLILAAIIGDLYGLHLKHLISELRPCSASAGFAALRPDLACGDTYLGMPSNHAINFFTVALFVMMTRPQWRGWHMVLVCAAILASLSRIYLAKHYPSQVVSGAFIGINIGILSALLFRYREWIVNMLFNLNYSRWREI